MERGTGDEPKPKKLKTTGNSQPDQSLAKQQQHCAVEDDHKSCSEQQRAAGTCRQFSATDDESYNKTLASHRKQLLKMLPEELWRMILEKVDNSVDLLSVSNSSPFFRELLLPKRVDFLFKSVLQILERPCRKHILVADKIEKKLDAGNDATADPEEDLNDLLSRLDDGWVAPKMIFNTVGALKKALPLRLVSRSWNKEIDSLLEHRTLNVSVMQDLTRLLSDFAATHGSTSTRSPFVGKSICIYADQQRGIEVVNNGVHTLLDKYGQHFWHCTFLLCGSANRSSPIFSFFSRLGELLQKTPSLKTLKVMFIFLEASRLSSEEKRVLKTQMIFPALPELQELRVEGGLPVLPIFWQLLRINGHVSTSSSTTTGEHFDGPFVSNLKSLWVEPCSQNHFRMITANQFQWHLTRLCLNLPGCGFSEWPSVFTALKNKFGKTLTHLRLTLPKLASRADGDRILEDGKQFKTHLPQLFYLELAVGVENFPSEDDRPPIKDYNRIFAVFKKDAQEPNVKYSKTCGWVSSTGSFFDCVDSVFQPGEISDDFSDDE